MHKVRVRKPGKPVRELALMGEITIGRHPENVLTLVGSAISNRHARMVLDEDECFLEDLDSRNGTVVNGEKLEAGVLYQLAGGEEIRVGSFHLEYLPEPMMEPSTVELLTQEIDYEPVLPEAVLRRRETRWIRVMAGIALVVCIAALASVVVRRIL